MHPNDIQHFSREDEIDFFCPHHCDSCHAQYLCCLLCDLCITTAQGDEGYQQVEGGADGDAAKRSPAA